MVREVGERGSVIAGAQRSTQRSMRILETLFRARQVVYVDHRVF